MHNDTTHRAPRIVPPQPYSGAITWIDRSHAIVARTMPSGAIDVAEIDLGAAHGVEPAGLVRVADAIGNRDCVVVTGPLGMRTALERQYVALYQRPDRLVDVDATVPLTRRELVERLRELMG